ncbi:MAG: Hpt domain-containing protein [Coriobacteriales bacterium]|nr:Hpt domain-containing protein [Coriobacteriales bacterium]
MADFGSETGVEGLDYAAGLAEFPLEKIYRRILRTYIRSTPALLEKLQSDLQDPSDENIQDYITTVHGLKGASYGVHANLVGDKAKALEFAAKDGDLKTVFSQNDALIATTQRMLSDLEAYLDATPEKD